MQIIQHGVSSKLPRYLFSCDNCGCLFVANTIESEQAMLPGKPQYKHRCPDCACLVYSSELAPEVIAVLD